MTIPIRVPQLTRDKCWHPRPGIPERTEIVDKPLRAALLVGKLHSEVQEVANDLANPKEYADVLDSLVALAKLNGVTWHEIVAASVEKVDSKGGLDAGVFWISADFEENADGRQVAA